MRALSHGRFGGPEVLTLGSRSDKQTTLRAYQVRIRVRAAALNPKDVFLRKGRFRLLARAPFPRLVGHDYAGVVEACGEAVLGLAPGTRVFGALSWSGRQGSLADELVVPAGTFGRMPDAMTFEDAAAMPIAALTGLQALRDVARLSPGESVLVHGASGGVGTFAVQIAKRLGARVTTTSSARNTDLCRGLGADETLDYAADVHLDRRYRVVFDVMGNLGFAASKRALEPRGIYVSTVPSLRLLADVASTRLSARRAALVVVASREQDLETLASWYTEGALRSVIDDVFALEDFAAAFARLESRRARGKIVVRVSA